MFVWGKSKLNTLTLASVAFLVFRVLFKGTSACTGIQARTFKSLDYVGLLVDKNILIYYYIYLV